jgi:hypothetical protein
VNGPGIGDSVHLIAPSGASLDGRVKDAGKSTLLLRVDGDVAELAAGNAVSIEFANRRGICRMPGTAHPAGGSSVRIDATGKVELIQRRDYVRVEAFVPVAFQPIGPQGWTVTAHTLDVSGGGFQIAEAEGLKLDDMMSFRLDLGDGEDPLTAVALAVRETGEGGFGMKFVELLESERSRLIRWVFARERLARQIGRHL